jgi:hypothetical protein
MFAAAFVAFLLVPGREGERTAQHQELMGGVLEPVPVEAD